MADRELRHVKRTLNKCPPDNVLVNGNVDSSNKISLCVAKCCEYKGCVSFSNLNKLLTVTVYRPEMAQCVNIALVVRSACLASLLSINAVVLSVCHRCISLK